MDNTQTILALSIKQPWAWAILHGGKNIENRKWPTKHRGRILIHAGKTFDMQGYDFLCTNEDKLFTNGGNLFTEMPNYSDSDFELGGIVGRVDIVDCVQHSTSPWFYGPWGFILENPIPCKLWPMRGQLGLFPVTVMSEWYETIKEG